MKVGTKSILFGYHQFLIHPLFVALAWWKLYGFPWDPRLWVAFFVHDVGYWGKPNMDGAEGESHPFVGAKIMGALFDAKDVWGHRKPLREWYTPIIGGVMDYFFGHCPFKNTWYCFTFYHSRFLCKRYNTNPTQMCYADKLAIIITPTWLQLLLMNLTGEIQEYMQGRDGRTSGQGIMQRKWVEEMKLVVRAFLSESMGTCFECGADCKKYHWMCDEAASFGFPQWCPECFEKTPCGRGDHGEGCPTMVAAMDN